MKTEHIGHITADKHVYITDRLKELIRNKRAQATPADQGGLVGGHEKVVDACVLGLWNADETTEVPRAYKVKNLAARDVEDVVWEKELWGGSLIKFLDTRG
ncbi:hypothetical protein ONS96_009008 [Cadophora gregata f. sp. sojae]|nr:hypothetical protein ONS96_009008 [Cadophora gregata f. sp. sojae]